MDQVYGHPEAEGLDLLDKLAEVVLRGLAEHRRHVHVELREVLQALQPRPERAERLLDVAAGVGLEGVDADGEVVEPGLVQGLDDAVAEQEAVGDDADVRLAAGVRTSSAMSGCMSGSPPSIVMLAEPRR